MHIKMGSIQVPYDFFPLEESLTFLPALVWHWVFCVRSLFTTCPEDPITDLLMRLTVGSVSVPAGTHKWCLLTVSHSTFQ